MKPIAYEIRNGCVGFQLCYEKEMADRVAAEQQKRHNLSGSLAAFRVVPLFDIEQTQKPQAPTVDLNCTCDEHGACAYCWNGKKHDVYSEGMVCVGYLDGRGRFFYIDDPLIRRDHCGMTPCYATLSKVGAGDTAT